RIWLIGNRLLRASAARGQARIRWDSSRISTKKPATPWWRSNLRSCSRIRGRTLMPPNGTRPPRHDSGAPSGKAKPRKLPYVWAGVLERLRRKESSTPKSRLIRSEEHTSELQSRGHLVCRLLLEKKK